MMKKNVIALLLAVIMASGSVGAVPAFATETTAEEAVAVEEESVDEQEEVTGIMEDSDFGLTVEDVLEEENTQTEEELVQEDEETEDETVLSDEQEAPVNTVETTEIVEAKEEEISESASEGASSTETEEQEVIEEKTVIAEKNEAMHATSGKCGDNAYWKLTGTGDDLALTIYGSGEMDCKGYTGPWIDYYNHIKTIVVEEGITSIMSYAFDEGRKTG